MDRERAETYLRLLAESELRRATMLPVGQRAGQRHAPRLALAAQALSTAGAVDAGTAAQIRAELELALTARRLSRPGLSPRTQLDRLTLSRMLDERDTALVAQVQRARIASTAFPASGSDAGHPAAPWRVVPVGQVIRGNGLRGGGDLLLLAYVQAAAGAQFTMASAMAGSPRLSSRQLTATDDQGTSYQLEVIGGFRTGALELRPDPPRAIRWLDLTTAPGEPATRIDLDPPDPPGRPPEITVTRTATSPGEILLDVIAARILTSTGRSISPAQPEHLAGITTDLRAFVGDGPGNITAALLAVGALSPASPVPGQLAGLCERLGVPGHGITAPPAADLPQPWQSMLTGYHRKPHPALAPGSWATAVAGLPELGGVQITVLGLHDGEPGTILHMLASGVTLEDNWSYGRGVRPLPVLWIRDSNGHWHTTRTSRLSPWNDTGMVMLWLAIVPPLEADAAWIDMVAAAPSATVRARLPLRWQ
jgi:hypothetical protein